MKKLISSIVLAVLCATPLLAAEWGDPAKPLDIKEWVKGSPVNLADGLGKNIYVVEFWATWCPPCRASIPHLTEVQKKFKDQGVVVIGVTSEESDVVKKFVDKMSDQMNYTVAIDGGKTTSDYSQAYGFNGIPHAFIVDKAGKVAWAGYVVPSTEFDKALEEIIAGTYDFKAAKAESQKGAELAKRQSEINAKVNQFAQAIVNDPDGEETKKLEAEVVALDKELGGLVIDGKKFELADFRQRTLFRLKMSKYQRAVVSGSDTNELAELEKDLQTGAPSDFSLAKFKDDIALGIERRNAVPLFRGYLKSVSESGDPAKAAELAKQIEDMQLRGTDLIDQLAGMILVDGSVKNRDVKLALNLSKRAVDLSESKNPQFIATYARALFENGKKDDAIEQLKKAIALANDEMLKAQLQKLLEEYQAKPSDTAKVI